MGRARRGWNGQLSGSQWDPDIIEFGAARKGKHAPNDSNNDFEFSTAVDSRMYSCPDDSPVKCISKKHKITNSAALRLVSSLLLWTEHSDCSHSRHIIRQGQFVHLVIKVDCPLFEWWQLVPPPFILRAWPRLYRPLHERLTIFKKFASKFFFGFEHTISNLSIRLVGLIELLFRICRFLRMDLLKNQFVLFAYIEQLLFSDEEHRVQLVLQHVVMHSVKSSGW